MFEERKRRIELVVAKSEKLAKRLLAEREALSKRLGEPSIAALDRQLRLHLERVQGRLLELREELGTLNDLIALSPPLPGMERPGKGKA